MGLRRSPICVSLLLTFGCGGGEATPTNVNPYANQQAAANAPPMQAPARRPPPKSGGRGTADAAEPEPGKPSQPIEVPEAGAAAEMAVPLSFLEYATFARESAEMLAEMSSIHAAVTEAGKADPKQQNRWGQLTAEHTALARRVVQEGYPPAELARELLPNAISRLHAELAHAKGVMEEYDDLEGGLAQPYAQAERIFEHLTKNLSAAEVESLGTGEG